MFVIIVGGGKVGAFLAKDLRCRGHSVVVVEKDKQKCEKIASETDVMVINGDGCDERYLEEAQVGRADVLAAVTGDDDDNLVACQLAKSTFNVPKIVARVNNPKNEHIFQKMGIRAISSTTVISRLIEEEATIDDIITLYTLSKGSLAIVELLLPEDRCIVCNKAVKDLGLPPDCILVAIIRGDRVIIPRGSTILQEGDNIIAVTKTEKEEQLRQILLG